MKKLLFILILISCAFAFTFGNVLNAETVCGDTITEFCAENTNIFQVDSYLDYTCGNATYQTYHLGDAPKTNSADVVVAFPSPTGKIQPAGIIPESGTLPTSNLPVKVL